MEKISFDSGIREYRLNGSGVLRFNPCDPNLYVRFLEAADKISALEKELMAEAKGKEDGESGENVVQLLQSADKSMKSLLSWVFGQENDFDKLLGGVNLLAVGSNGERVVTNLFHALQPVLLAGAKTCAAEQTKAAVARAERRRASR